LFWSFAYLVVRNLFALVWLLGRPRRSKELEILVLRHELAILRRQVARSRRNRERRRKVRKRLPDGAAPVFEVPIWRFRLLRSIRPTDKGGWVRYSYIARVSDEWRACEASP
jgi:hypothetical protein